MACSFLPSRVLDKNSDTLSEASESGTITSEWTSNWDSKEELRDLLSKLGLKEVSDLHQDRFRVDRKKLEQMLTGDNEALIPADVFFAKIMEDTDTYITWPNKLKIGAKSKKDPHVRIAGRPEDVKAAKERIITLLDTKELIPLIFGFELPIMTQNVDATSSYIVKVQEQYKVQVMFKTRPKLHATLVLVKGLEWEVDQVKQATILLMEYMCESLASQISVQMSMEISPHHHQVVLGKNHSNLKQIMQYTNCQIMFPDAQDPNIPNLKKSNVNISGTIHEVYKARQLLMGSLPLIIIFDLPEECVTLRTRQDQLAEIQANYDVTITIRQKAKQNTRACVIKGVEKNAENIYKARAFILGFDESGVHADIPSTYHFSAVPTSQASINSSLTPTNNNNVHSLSPMISPLISPSWHNPPTPTVQNGPPFVGMVQQPQFVYSTSQQSVNTSGYQSMAQNPLTSSSMNLEQSSDNAPGSTMSSNSSICSNMSSPINSTSPFHRQFVESQNPRSDLSSILSDMNFSPGYHGPSVDRRQDINNLTLTELENKRLAGLRAMQNKPMTGTYRQPNNSWSGYYISHTSPTPFADIVRQKKEEDVWNASPKRNDTYNPNSASASLNTSNILDHTPSHILNNLVSSEWPDLPTMMNSLGLQRYINTFTRHEIDLTIFSTLTDKDLIEIGINTFGARRKILLAISELNKRSSSFSAAPGAERRNSPLKAANYSASSDQW